MIASRTDARDRILAPLKIVVDAQSLYAVYDDTNKKAPIDGSAWARVSVRHARGSRSSLGREDGKSKNTQTGFIFVEVYTPRDDGLTTSDVLVAAFGNSLRSGADGDIWINDVAEVEMGEDGDWFRVDVIAEFSYDLIV
jgi:hypothetical protein